MTRSARLVEIVTTVGSEDQAAELARTLVSERVAACASFFAIRSVYRWKGEVLDEPEFQVVLKTVAECAPSLERRLREMHPYETPAILRVPIERANAEYAAWVVENADGGGGADGGGDTGETR